MALDDAALDHLADLARLELDEEERTALRLDLARLLDYLAHLQGVDVEGVAAMTRPEPDVAPAHQGGPPPGLRSDAVSEERRLPPETLEALAPAWQEGRFRVARTVDDAG